MDLSLGIVSLLVAIWGFINRAGLENVMNFTVADNRLHLFLGVVLARVAPARRRDATRPADGAIR